MTANSLVVGTGGLNIIGNFVISGQTIYNTDTFTLNANATTGKNAYFQNYRGNSSANAIIRWNEGTSYWELNDVNNPNLSSTYSKILTANLISDSLTSTASSTIASSAAANTLNNNIIAANNSQTLYTNAQITANAASANSVINTRITANAASTNAYVNAVVTANVTSANAYTDASNTNNILYTNAQITANAVSTNSVVSTANSSMKSYVDANVSSLQIQISSNVTSLQGQITANVTNISGIDSYQNTNITITGSYANSAYTRANSSACTFVGTTGTATPSTGSITFASNNGVLISGQGSTLYVNTAQDLRTSASPTFNSLTLTNPLATTQGGTGSATTSGAIQTLLGGLGSGVSGYAVLTNGSGSFYLGSTGGGTTTTVGTLINISSNTQTAASGQTWFYSANVATNTPYTPGLNQLKVFINGVRQTLSDYTEYSNGAFNLSSPATSGDIVLSEVYGQYTYNNWANATTFTINSDISLTANTVQLAIDGLTSKVTSYYANTSSSYSNPSWITTLASTKITGTIPAANVSGLATSATTDTSNATNISTGTLNAARLPYSMDQAVATTSNVQHYSVGVGTAASGTIGEIRATGAVTASYSDDRLKTKLGNIEDALNKVMDLNGFYYEANETAQSLGYKVKREIGLSAQEVQKVLPEIISPAPIDDKYLTIHYERVIPLLVEAIKELKQEIDMLKGSK